MSNQTVSYLIRCQCKYCQQCTKIAIIYDECEGCYEGNHPDLRHILHDLENHLKKMRLIWKETRDTLGDEGKTV